MCWIYAATLTSDTGSETHSGADGAERHHPLDVVGVVAAPGLPAGVVASLQDELLPAEARVLIAHPAAQTDRHTER